MKVNVEQIFLSALGSNEKLKWYLQHNINVVEYLNNSSNYLTITDLILAFVPKSKKTKMFEDFTIQKILDILAKDRPDLFKTINNPSGLGWMRDQIDNFEKRFLS